MNIIPLLLFIKKVSKSDIIFILKLYNNHFLKVLFFLSLLVHLYLRHLSNAQIHNKMFSIL